MRLNIKVTTEKSAFYILACLILLVHANGMSQNTLAVPFTSGFVGDVNGNNSSSNTVYLSSLGCSGIYFSQNSNSTVFMSQGNDIIGSILITDNAGIEHEIPGFIKWRAPSGNTKCLVFSPSGSDVLSTSSGNYTVNSNKYIGLIFNGQTLVISSGNVSGNAATSGLLDVLNSYLVAFPTLSLPDYSINESEGSLTLTMTLSAPSSNEIKVSYTTMDGVALAGLDYNSVTGQLIFAPNQTTSSITLFVLSDMLAEPSELLTMDLTNPINVSITNSKSNITILDNPPLPVELSLFEVSCLDKGTEIKWTTTSEFNSDYFVLDKKNGDGEWTTIKEIDAAGVSTDILNYSFVDYEEDFGTKLYRLKQIDFNGNFKLFCTKGIECNERIMNLKIYPNPSDGVFKLYLSDMQPGTYQMNIVAPDGTIKIDRVLDLTFNNYELTIQNTDLLPGMYWLNLIANGQTLGTKLYIY